MQLYKGVSSEFIQEATRHTIAGRLKQAFIEQLRYEPSIEEQQSWDNSLEAVSKVFKDLGFFDHGILLEYQLPLTSLRLDCLITGKNFQGTDHAVIIELKQWQKSKPSYGKNQIVTWRKQGEVDVLHPSAQVERYKEYLEGNHSAFHEGDPPVKLTACCYLHNYLFSREDPIFHRKFLDLLYKYPVFCKDRVDKLKKYLHDKLQMGQGMPILDKILDGKYKQSKKLMEQIGKMINGDPAYILLDEQQNVFDQVMAIANQAQSSQEKTAIIVEGGPGSGKSVIAMRLLGELLQRRLSAEYLTGSKALTKTFQEKTGNFSCFKYFNQYERAYHNQFDFLICDEAHRIREPQNHRGMQNNSDSKSIDDILRATRTSIFFVDDDQMIRPDEVGTIEYITKKAAEKGCVIKKFVLEAQFRCSGSLGFVNWVTNTLDIRKTANVLWQTSNPHFEIKIYNTPQELESAIIEKHNRGATARLVAGFCWPWAEQLEKTGGNSSEYALKKDVVISEYNYMRPWNANSKINRLPRNIPKEVFWATDPNGIGQIGCVFTAQGFEFDYVGVIFGKDLVYRFDQNQWIEDKSSTCDYALKKQSGDITKYLKNAYRILLTRGMKGCYIYFQDMETRKFFESRIEKSIRNSG